MPRMARSLEGGGYFHIINRGNNRLAVFHSRLDYLVFVGLMKEARRRYPIRVLSYCLMPNHFHLIVAVQKPENLQAFMRWVTGCYSRHYHESQQSSGHLWQGRFRSHRIDREEYLITAIRYVEGNPKRAGLVGSNGDWEWSSLDDHCHGNYSGLTDPPPFRLADGWLGFVEMPLTQKEIEIMKKAKRDSPPSGDSPQETSP